MTPTKQALRTRYRALRHTRNDAAICEALRAVVLDTVGIDAGAKHLGLYWPLSGETDWRPLLPQLKGQPLALPSADGQGGLRYHAWQGEALVPDGCGILAPLEQPVLSPADMALLLVPALAVDHDGIRLGYGGGYYDRLRADPRWQQVPAVAVVCAGGISSAPLPRDPWDRPFDGWVSEAGVQWRH